MSWPTCMYEVRKWLLSPTRLSTDTFQRQKLFYEEHLCFQHKSRYINDVALGLQGWPGYNVRMMFLTMGTWAPTLREAPPSSRLGLTCFKRVTARPFTFNFANKIPKIPCLSNQGANIPYSLMTWHEQMGMTLISKDSQSERRSCKQHQFVPQKVSQTGRPCFEELGKTNHIKCEQFNFFTSLCIIERHSPIEKVGVAINEF